MRLPVLLSAVLLLSAAFLPPQAAHAAQSYDSCTGFIDSLPAVIGTQGVWCLRKDLSTAQASGSAIRIAANNVTIDCNGFKVGGLAAGNASQAQGISAVERQNVTIRDCNVRGFLIGVSVVDGSGHRIEDNRINDSLYAGIDASGANQSIRRNRVLGTGRHANNGNRYGIYAFGEVVDNAVVGVSAGGSNSTAAGIVLDGVGTVARGNTVRALHVSGTDAGNMIYGIYAYAEGIRIERNDLAGASAQQTRGIVSSEGFFRVFCGHNTVSGFQLSFACIDTGGNVDF